MIKPSPRCIACWSQFVAWVSTEFSPHKNYLRKVAYSTWMKRFIAVDCAARTSPSISAPVKFFVWTAKSARSTSAASNLCSRIFAVWISRICTRPCSSGRPEEEPTHAETTFWGDYCRHLSRNSKHFHSVKEHLWDTHSFFFKLRLSARPWKTMSILRQIWFFSTKFLTWSHPESTRLAS